MSEKITVQCWNGSGPAAIRADIILGRSTIAATGFGDCVTTALKNLLEGSGAFEEKCIRLMRQQNLAIVDGNSIEWLFLDHLAQEK
jgi:hypothetical protein